MSTRRKTEDGPVSQERYLSSPAYTVARVSGIAVIAKAALLKQDERELLFFLQSLSLERGGLLGIAEQIITMFPDRVGTPAMRKHKVQAGQILSAAVAEEIQAELDRMGLADPERAAERRRRMQKADAEHVRRLLAAAEDDVYDTFEIPANPVDPDPAARTDAGFYLERFNAETLAKLLLEICINPAVPIGEAAGGSPFFHDLRGALFEFQERYNTHAAGGHAHTSIAKQMEPLLDSALRSGKIVLIEGQSDIGKTAVLKSWCNQRRGRVRYVSLTGVTNKTVFFRAISREMGLASSYTCSTTEMQARVEDALARSGLCLAVDEAHYLWVQGERIRSRPELIDWIYSALTNRGVPVILSATPLFSARLAQAERQTIWNSDQFRRRITRMHQLPQKPMPRDVECVVLHRCPGLGAAALKYVTSYACATHHPFTSACELVNEAVEIAAAEGRTAPRFSDFEKAVKDVREPSENAKHSAFDAEQATRRNKRTRPPARAPLTLTDDSEEEPEQTFTGRRPVAALETHPANSGRSGSLQEA